ncbi:alginate lyase family protein [uncultured Formosa sp.]|uniref:alginate lyase family protein n=1 Tax=uncultured Formosa sp. TaxID=255435 RepID=UPI00260AFEFC|nr:alginate lyase family protein [uncultured Formosa sp.]
MSSKNTSKHALYLLVIMCLFSIKMISNPLIRLDSTRLASAKNRITNGTASEKTLEAYKNLLQHANRALKLDNPTVLNKSILPPSGDKHDYLSISRYWWPDPSTESGLPWIRLDGKTNPDTQTEAVDRKRLAVMGRTVCVLSLAYYFTENETYATKAISMLDTWFINPETLMNPHLKFGQSIPGKPNTRPFGILDGRSIVQFIPDAIHLISTSKQWTDTNQLKMTAWFTAYLEWLTQSPLGIKGSLLNNNHGSWYKFQVAALAMYLGNKNLTKNTIVATENSLEQMINTEGGQVHELERTRSFFYSCFNLEALISIAKIGDYVNLNMWTYETESKKSLTLALHYLTAVIDGAQWNHDTLKTVEVSNLLPIVSAFYDTYKTEEYRSLLKAILTQVEDHTKDTNLQEFWLFHPDFN